MAYTVIINDDNTVTVSEKQRIMQRSKLVDTLRFLVPKTYHGVPVESSSFVLQYRTPISHQLKIETLEVADFDYKNDFILYTMPIDTGLTAENGAVEIMISFKEVSMNPDGEVVVQNRNIDKFSIDIIPIENWFTVPDEALDTLTQYYVANQMQIQALNDLANTINQSKLDDIKLDIEKGKLMGVTNGESVGEGVLIEELGNEIAEKTQQGTVKLRV